MTVPRRCQGDVTFNEIYRNAFSEWPRHIPGYICKTPPVGRGSAPRFAQCCSGPLYNITHITGPSDPAFPVSCAAFCQVDPKMDETNSRYPFGWSEHFMCLTDGGEEPSNWEVVCGSVSVSGMPFPTSYESTIKGSWQTKSYYRPSDSPDWITVDPNSPTTGSATITSSSGTPKSTAATTSDSDSQTSKSVPSSAVSSPTSPRTTSNGGGSSQSAPTGPSTTTGTPSAGSRGRRSSASTGLVLVCGLILSTCMYL